LRSYLSSDDSALLRQALGGYHGGTCLEIGFGSGSNLPLLCDRFDEVAATDILRATRASEGSDCADLVYCDRAACFRDSSFDFVVFNPPYLPSNGVVDPTVDGGRGGIEVPEMFMEEAIRVVRPSGTILFMLSSEGDVSGFLRYCERRGFPVKPLRERGLFFETLFVYEAKKVGRSED
jgi:release factor glutamine methyltransferase